MPCPPFCFFNFRCAGTSRFYRSISAQVEKESGGTLVCHSITRGGAYLNAYKTPSDELSVRLCELLEENEYDYVVLQEQSLNAVTNLEDYLSSVKNLKNLLGKAKILIYQTWSYKDGSPLLESTGMSYREMTDKLEIAANKAATEIGAEAIPVGRVFYDTVMSENEIELYDVDALHPSEAGTALAAKCFLDFLCK